MSARQVEIDKHRYDIESLLPKANLKSGVDVRIEIYKIHAMLAIVSALEMIRDEFLVIREKMS